ncbi:putative cytochrome P450 superfamily [Helianthus anomalus]
MSYGGQDMVFPDNNANWRKLRKLSVHKMLSNVNLDRSSSVRWDEVRRAVKNVFGKIGTKELEGLLIRTIWESQSDKGVTNSNIVAEIDKVASKVTQILGRTNISDFFPILARFDLQGVVRDMKKQRNKLDQLFTTIIDDRIKSNLKMLEEKTELEGKKDFLQVLLDYKDEKARCNTT